MILKMPLIEPGQSVDSLRCSQEERMLIGFWLGTGNHTARQTLSPRGIERYKGSPSAWGEKCRQRIASQVEFIKRWRVECKSYEDIDTEREATWFVDPPYEVRGRHYPKGSDDIDYGKVFCRSIGAGK